MRRLRGRKARTDGAFWSGVLMASSVGSLLAVIIVAVVQHPLP
jgi:hypothetical protein